MVIMMQHLSVLKSMQRLQYDNITAMWIYFQSVVEKFGHANVAFGTHEYVIWTKGCIWGNQSYSLQ